MATIYNIEIVSDFCAYSEDDLIKLIKHRIEKPDPDNGLKLRVTKVQKKE